MGTSPQYRYFCGPADAAAKLRAMKKAKRAKVITETIRYYDKNQEIQTKTNKIVPELDIGAAYRMYRGGEGRRRRGY